MRRAEIPPEDRGDVYRLVFFAWADGGLKWEEEKYMRRYAKEMGWQWRRFSRTLEHYKRLCSPESMYRLPVFLLRNLKQSLPEVSSEFGQSLPEVSSEFGQSLPEVSSEFGAENGLKSFNNGEPHDMSEAIVRSHSQKAEEEGDGGGAPFDNFTDERTLMAEAVATVTGLMAMLDKGDGAAPLHEAASDFVKAGCTPADVTAYEQDFTRRKVAQGKPTQLTLKILREDLVGFVRTRRLQDAEAKAGKNAPNRPPVVVAPPDWRRKLPSGGSR
jgi:hypothetical protein